MIELSIICSNSFNYFGIAKKVPLFLNVSSLIIIENLSVVSSARNPIP